MRIFGSVATGAARPGSDVDVIVLTESGGDWLSPDYLRQELEALLGCRVDVATDQYLRPRVVAAAARTHAVPL